MSIKKKIPFFVFKVLDKFPDFDRESIAVVLAADNQLRLEDKDPASDFYFQAIRKEGEYLWGVEVKPGNLDDISRHSFQSKTEGVSSYFWSWISSLQAYARTNGLENDRIIAAYTQEYFKNIEFVDEQAEQEPLSINQALNLDEHLDNVAESVKGLRGKVPKAELDTLLKDVKDLRSKLTAEPKSKIAKALAMIWARITKWGPQILKGIVAEVKKRGYKEGLDFIIEVAGNLLH